MQVSQTDSEKARRVGVDEQFIKFRPSPNFKNMKKFLKSKIDYIESANSSPPSTASDPTSPRPNNEQKEEVKPVDRVKPVVQPPLPLDPPPPDSPPQIKLTLKKEIDDTEYQNEGSEDNLETLDLSSLITDIKTDESEHTEKRKPPICKDFIRGTCNRQGSCKYTHEYDISQLGGVYTFCRNFQNSVCTFPNCKYVHATVFEEQRFYRTGVLPPHTLNHQKKITVMQPPPPPPPPPPPTEIKPDILPNFSVPPPTLHPTVEKPLPVISCVPRAVLEPRPEALGPTRAPASLSPLKREWSDLSDFSNSPRDYDLNENFAKKCKNCEITEFRLQYNKEKVANMLSAAEERNKKMVQLNKKTHRLYSTLLTLLKPTNPLKTAGAGGVAPSLNISEEKEKTFMEYLNNFLNSNCRPPLAEENTNKNVLSGNLSSLMSKLLCNSGESALSSQARALASLCDN